MFAQGPVETNARDVGLLHRSRGQQNGDFLMHFLLVDIYRDMCPKANIAPENRLFPRGK